MMTEYYLTLLVIEDYIMRLADLDNVNAKINVVLVNTNSSKLHLFLNDKLKRQAHCNADNSFNIYNKDNLREIKELIGICPPFSDRWFVHIDLDNINTKEIGLSDIADVINKSNTVLFYCVSNKYATYKKMKELLRDTNGLYDFYLSYLRRADFIYLYDAFVPVSQRLSQQLFNFVLQTYADKVDILFDLFQKLADGIEITTRKEIIDICGAEETTPESYVFSLLKPLSGSDRGFKTTMKQRMKAGLELSSGIEDNSFRRFYGYMRKNIDAMIAIKMLLISGKIYKDIPKEWLDYYSEHDNLYLDKYQRYLWKLKTIPLSRLLLLRQSMGTCWNTDSDFFTFLYTYYNQMLKTALSNKLKNKK